MNFEPPKEIYVTYVPYREENDTGGYYIIILQKELYKNFNNIFTEYKNRCFPEFENFEDARRFVRKLYKIYQKYQKNILTK